MQCPKCQKSVPESKAFCPRCGTAVAGHDTSTVTVDRESLEKLLAVHAPAVRLAESKLKIGPVELDPVRILKPDLRLRFGGYNLSVDQLTLGPDGLSASLHLR